MELTERQINGVTIVDIFCDFAQQTATSRALREKVAALVHGGERSILLNVDNVKHADSSFIAEMVESYKAATSKGGVLKLAHVDRHLQSVLRSTKLDSILKSYDAEDEALASF